MFSDQIDCMAMFLVKYFCGQSVLKNRGEVQSKQPEAKQSQKTGVSLQNSTAPTIEAYSNI